MSYIHLLPPIDLGASAEVRRLGGGLVLKLYHAGVEAGIVRREMDCSERASVEGVAVPRQIGSQTIEGRQGIVFEELKGKPLLAPGAGFRIGRARDALRKLASSHADIHQRSADGLFHQQHDMLQVRIEAADADAALKRAALAYLHTLPHGDRLCHGDFHPRNAIETDAGIVAIDWSSGGAGDPAGDVARTELLLRYGRYDKLQRNFWPARWPRHLAADFYLQHYVRMSGTAKARIAAWRFPVAVSCLGRGSAFYRPALLAALRRYHAY